jgi:hypothetical protein
LELAQLWCRLLPVKSEQESIPTGGEEGQAIKHFLMSMCIAILAVSAGLAQEKKAEPPPPKPADEGPNLEVTMKFIQEKLKAKLTRWDDVTADPASCQLTFARSGKWADHDWEDETLAFSFAEVEKIQVLPFVEYKRLMGQEEDPDSPTSPDACCFFRFLMTTEKSVHLRHFKKGKPRPKEDKDSGEWVWAFKYEADQANRVAKAMVHAVELCGGGAKPEPF